MGKSDFTCITYIPFYFYLGHLSCSYSSDRYSVCGKRPLAIAAMNEKLPSFKNGTHNFESMSTIDRVITPLTSLRIMVILGQAYPSLFYCCRKVANSMPSSSTIFFYSPLLTVTMPMRKCSCSMLKASSSKCTKR